jgi:hypothetical protein
LVNLFSQASSRERSKEASLQKQMEEKEVEMLDDEPYTRTKIFEARRKELRPDPLPDETMVDILVK